MKKKFVRTEAVIIAVSVFFCSIIYRPLKVEAASWTVGELVTSAIEHLGWKVFDEKIIDPILVKLGWKKSDIQVDENGNVILSEAQMNELKEAIQDYTKDADGNDKYGMFLYESTAESDLDFVGYGVSQSWFDWENSDEMLGWVYAWGYRGTNMSYANVAPVTSIWVGSPGGSVSFYDDGTYELVDAPYATCMYRYGYTWDYSTRTSSCAGTDNYYGPSHIAFETISGYKAWKNDGNPYEMVTPTYTGGTLTISADQLNGTNTNNTVSSNDFDDDGNPVTEKGWLQRIYERLGDILDQVKQIKWLSVTDVVIDAIDTFGEDVENVAGALVESISMVFPLCIAWDFVEILKIFVAEPSPPVFEIPLQLEQWNIDYTFCIDLTDWDWAVKMLRVFELLAFIVGLFNLTTSWVGKGDDV